MIYNEGFEIKLNNIDLFSFSFYEKISNIKNFNNNNLYVLFKKIYFILN
jgi:hypothetical protein